MKRIIAALVLVVLVGAGLWWALAPAPAPMGQRPPTVVNLAPSIERSLFDRVEAVGTARAAQAVTILTEVPGRVAKIHFRQGQKVEEGKVLVTLDDRNASAELARSEAEYQRALNDFQRGQKLVKSRAISQSEVDTFRTTLDGAKASRDAARANFNDHTIRAPFAGVVGLRQVDAGVTCKPAMPSPPWITWGISKWIFRCRNATWPGWFPACRYRLATRPFRTRCSKATSPIWIPE